MHILCATLIYKSCPQCFKLSCETNSYAFPLGMYRIYSVFFYSFLTETSRNMFPLLCVFSKCNFVCYLCLYYETLCVMLFRIHGLLCSVYNKLLQCMEKDYGLII